ncbi:uncharacterized protein LOC134227903 [Armigeres subalbatus]|uniref:uncharacterized protein LOC134227903 n=1 Tax=Armigeres subalbatus TaxID=124917 RepID=UPI002ED4B91F
MSPNSLKVLNWNVCSIDPKKEELSKFLKYHEIDVAVLTETHLKPKKTFSISGYDDERQDRKDRPKGGVAILVRNTISHSRVEVATSVIESAGVELELAGEKLIIYASYCPEQCNSKTEKQFIKDLRLLTRPKTKTKFLVIGDLNARHTFWGDDKNNKNGELIFDDASHHKYYVKLPEDPTFITCKSNASYLDICLANFVIDKPKRTDPRYLKSDHFPVIYDLGKSAGAVPLAEGYRRGIRSNVPATAGNVAARSINASSSSSSQVPKKRDHNQDLRHRLNPLQMTNHANSSTEAQFILRQILQKCREFNVPTHHLYVNFKTSYRTIDREQLWRTIKGYDGPENLIQELQTIVNRTAADSKNGLKMDNELSSLLMYIAQDAMIREAGLRTSGTIFRNALQVIRFADDMVLIAKSLSTLEQAYVALKEIAAKFGLDSALKESKYMRPRILKDNHQSLPTVFLDGNKFAAVENVSFLDSFVTTDNNATKEISHCIANGEEMHAKHLPFFQSADKTLQEKLNIYKKEIRSKVLCGHESWILTKSHAKQLVNFEREVLRAIHGKIQAANGRAYYATYPKLVQQLGEPGIEHMARIGRLRWAGKVFQLAEDSPARMVLEKSPQGNRIAGRPPTRWIDMVEQDLKSLGCSVKLSTVVQNGDEWRALLEKAEASWK